MSAYAKVTITRKNRMPTVNEPLQQEITLWFKFNFRKQGNFDPVSGVWVETTPQEVDFDPEQIFIDGEPASEKEIEDILNDEELVNKARRMIAATQFET